MMHSLDTHVIIYSNRKFIYDLLSQHTQYKLSKVSCLSQLADQAINNCLLILDQPCNQVNYEMIDKLADNFLNIIMIVSQSELESYKSKLPMPIIYLLRPLRLQKLLAVIEQGFSNHQGAEIRLNSNYTFCPNSKIIIRQDPVTGQKLESIDLTDKETILLRELYNARGIAVDKAYILKNVWGHSALLETRTLETHIYKLRQKLGDSPELIFTNEYGYGLKTNDS